MKPEQNITLYKSTAFRVVILAPLVFAALFACYIFHESNLTPRSDYIGFNNLFLIFKFPLTIASLSFPLVALVAANHRSKQSKAQIQLALEQAERSSEQLLIARKHNEISVQPVISSANSTIHSSYESIIRNNGLGVASIKNFEFSLNGKIVTQKDFQNEINIQLEKFGNKYKEEKKRVVGAGSIKAGGYLAKGSDQTIVTVELEENNENDAIVRQLAVWLEKNVKLTIDYECMYGNRFVLKHSFS